MSRVVVCPCQSCGITYPGNSTVETCHECGGNVVATDRESARKYKFFLELEEERQRIRELDRKNAGEGFRYKAVVWIHPKEGGDDECSDVYFKQKPTEEQLQEILKRSAVKDDYRIHRLCPECGSIRWAESTKTGLRFCQECGHELGGDAENAV